MIVMSPIENNLSIDVNILAIIQQFLTFRQVLIKLVLDAVRKGCPLNTDGGSHCPKLSDNVQSNLAVSDSVEQF